MSKNNHKYHYNYHHKNQSKKNNIPHYIPFCMPRYNYFHSLRLFCKRKGLKAQLKQLRTVEEPFSLLP